MYVKAVLTLKYMVQEQKSIYQAVPSSVFPSLYGVILAFVPVDEMLGQKCSSIESYWAVLSCGTVCCAAQGGSYF